MNENDFDSIMERMLTNVSDKLDKREGSVIYDALAPAALELENAYAMMQMIQTETYADSASYYYLIKRAAERGIYPDEETCAVCRMVVTPAETPITIGDRFNLGTLNYTVTAEIQQGEYQITCETAGVSGNQQTGDLLVIETANDVNDMQTAKLTEVLIPGEDEEDVEAFRSRYFDSMVNEAFGGNKADYREKINQIDGVGACKTLRTWERGYRPANFLPSETVTAWMEQQSDETVGAEVFAWLQNVYDAASEKLLTVGGTVDCYIISSEFKTPSDTLVERVQNVVDPDGESGEGVGIAPIGHVVKVMGVQSKKIDICFEAVYTVGTTFESLQSSIEAAIDKYFGELAKNWSNEEYLTVRKSQIEARLLLISGILDISNTTLNGTEENVILGEAEIPVRGDVSG